jgi:hypothetical protein
MAATSNAPASTWADHYKALDFLAGADGVDTGHHAQEAGMRVEDCTGILLPTRNSTITVAFQGMDGEILHFGPYGRRP